MSKKIEAVPRYSAAEIDAAKRGGLTPRQLAGMRRQRVKAHGISPNGRPGVWDASSGHYVG